MANDRRPVRPPLGSFIVLGLLVGTVLGLLLDSLGLWIAIGIIAGCIADGARQAQAQRRR